jgi:hypothetical protein
LSDPVRHAALAEDCKALRDIFETLDRLEAGLEAAPRFIQARTRGYFTPDEDDLVRQMQLTYLTCRRALLNVIERCEDYPSEATLKDQLSRVIVALAAALTLYAKSLRLVEAYEEDPLVRKKLNEPDAKYGLDAGAFEEILASFTSFGNYRRLGRVARFWHRHRRDANTLGLETDADLGPLCDVIRRRRPAVRKQFGIIVRQRLRRDWSAFRRMIAAPLEGARYGVQSLFVGALAGVRTVRDYQPAVDPDALARLRESLRPGDILLVRSESKLGSALLPGFWGHAAIYAGTRDQVASLGVTGCGGFPGGADCVVEAIPAGVQVNPLEHSLRTDHVVVFRPAVSEDDKRAALVEAVSHVGKSYDFDFDFNVTTRLVCTELVYRSYHRRGGFNFALTKRLGRYTLTCDDIVSGLLEGGSRLPLDVTLMALQGADGRLRFIEPAQHVRMLGAIRDGFRPSAGLKDGCA